jgi:hypothetical protein
MLVRVAFIISLLIGSVFSTSAQIYDNDSATIEIKYKTDFLVRDYKDLNIEVIYFCKPGRKSIWTYERFQDFFRSPFGNCYFELYKSDSSRSFKNITFEVMGSRHPPKDFKSEEEWLQYDLEKILLSPGHKRVVTFNLLNFLGSLAKGEYSMKFYLRVASTYGYDKKGRVITNSITYVESATMNFNILEDLRTPNRLPEH